MNAPKNDNKVLACVNQSLFAEAVADCAAWAAMRMDAPLEFLHIIDRHPEIGSGEDHSGAIGFDAQEHLLQELSARDAVRSKQAREQGRVFLNGLRERAIAGGVAAPDMRQRYGGLEETLVEQAPGVRLFVLARPGASTGAGHGESGRDVERVVRALHKPVLTVPGSFRPPRRFMIAFDGGISARRGVELVAGSSLFSGLPCHLLMSGKPNPEARKQLAWASSLLADAGFEVSTEIIPGDAESVVARTVEAQAIDLLIMGAYAHSPLRSLLFGSRTTDLLRSAKVPALLLR